MQDAHHFEVSGITVKLLSSNHCQNLNQAPKFSAFLLYPASCLLYLTTDYLDNNTPADPLPLSTPVSNSYSMAWYRHPDHR